MEVIPGGCSSDNKIDRLDCRDRPEFDNSYCPKSLGYEFSIEECNSKCLDLESCVIFQRLSGPLGGACWFYGSPDPDGSNGEEDKWWKCGIKTCSQGIKSNFVKRKNIYVYISLKHLNIFYVYY